MSIVWNWEYKVGDSEIIILKCIGNYKTHQGNPGLLRSDSMLKAIGKSAILGLLVCNLPKYQLLL